MKIHEYPGKELLKKPGVAVPKGRPALSITEKDAAIDAVIQEIQPGPRLQSGLPAGSQRDGHGDPFPPRLSPPTQVLAGAIRSK